jgi:hypothetical protein
MPIDTANSRRPRKKTLTFQVPEDVHVALQREAEQLGLSIADILRLMVMKGYRSPSKRLMKTEAAA